MPKIIINEADFTSESIATNLTNATYIPGFAITDPSDDTYVLGEPTLFIDVDAFENAIGNKPFRFTTYAPIDEWSADGTYTQYQVVLYDKDYYVNKTGSNGDNVTPDEDTTNWATNKVDAWDDDALTYSVFTMVSYNGSIYVNITGDNDGSITPDEDTTNWKTNATQEGAGTYEAYGVDVECDVAYVYAHTLLENGLPIYYEVVDNGLGVKCDNVADFYKAFRGGSFDKLADKGSYSIKYITTGGYPVFKTATDYTILVNMIRSAQGRGDAIAIIDHTKGLPADKEDENSAFYQINQIQDSVIGDGLIDIGSYGAMLTPWATYRLSTQYVVDDTTVDSFELPASFAYMTCLSLSIKNNPDYMAIAGVTRGNVPYVDQRSENPIVTNKIADSYMTEGGKVGYDGRSINGITNIRPYGLTIWGNRTLIKNTEDKTTPALAYLNTRCMVCDVKKVVFEAAQRYMFEQNSDVLWINFKSQITPLLDRLSTSGGISGYKIIKQKSKTTAKLCATIILYPIYAVEEIEVTIELRNEEVTVA